jgi:hypothetical protein
MKRDRAFEILQQMQDDPKKIEDVDLVPPHPIAIMAARRSIASLSDDDMRYVKRIVPDGDGGISIECNRFWTIDISEDGDQTTFESFK